MRQPLAEMVTAAIDLLLARIRDPHRQLEVRQFPNELVIRGSTDHQQFQNP
jgi:DNA-binding LacI/PurR family transcriptional regulator